MALMSAGKSITNIENRCKFYQTLRQMRLVTLVYEIFAEQLVCDTGRSSALRVQIYPHGFRSRQKSFVTFPEKRIFTVGDRASKGAYPRLYDELIAQKCGL